MGVEVLNEMTEKVNFLDNENDKCMTRIKEMENINDNCMERVNQLHKGDDKHMKIIKCLEKENDSYMARENFYVCVVVVIVYHIVDCLCCTFEMNYSLRYVYEWELCNFDGTMILMNVCFFGTYGLVKYHK
jgi:hypothetical protein